MCCILIALHVYIVDALFVLYDSTNLLFELYNFLYATI